MDAVAPIIQILGGLAIAFLGRRLVWLIIAAAGFILTFKVLTWLLGDSTLALIIAIGVGAVAAYFATKFANILINIAGFILVGNAALIIYGWLFPTEQVWITILVFVVGGFIGLGLIRWMYSTALIIISALGGAAMVADGVEILALTNNVLGWLSSPLILTVIGVVVALVGFVYQYGVLKAEPSKEQ